jgi:hypothetical protein
VRSIKFTQVEIKKCVYLVFYDCREVFSERHFSIVSRSDRKDFSKRVVAVESVDSGSVLRLKFI